MKLTNSFLSISFLLFLAGNLIFAPNAFPQDKVMPPAPEQFYSLTNNQNDPMLTKQQPAPKQFSPEKTQVLQELNQARESNNMMKQKQAETKLNLIEGNSSQSPASDPRAVCLQPQNNQVPINGDYLTSAVNGLANWSIATATVPTGAPNAGRIWVVSTQYNTGSDTMRFYYSDNGGATWSFYTDWWYTSYNMDYRPGELDLEVVYDGTNVFLFVVAGFNDISASRALVNLTKFQVTGTFTFSVTTLNFPGTATTTNQYYNPRITSDNISYPNSSVYVYITTAFDSTTGSTHFLRQKQVTVTSPTTTTPAYNYSNAAWWNGSGYPAGAYYFNDIAYYRTTSSATTNRIMTLISVNMTYYGLYLAWSDDYGSTIAGTLVISETSPTRGSSLASSGLNTGTNLMLTYLRLFSGTDWDVAYQYSTTGGTTTGSWTMSYIDFTGYYASGQTDVIQVLGTTNQFKAAYTEDSSGVKAFYAGWNGTAWSTPSKLSVNGFACDTVYGKVRAGYKLGGGDDCVAIWAGVNGGAVYATRACLTTTGFSNNNNQIPKTYALQQNYPNPFNPTTVIRYSIPQNSAVKLTIYDMTGRAVKTLVNQVMNSGNYEVNFDASNIASGVYFYKLEAGSFVSTKKMTLIK
ncbi:MAG: T9SS type A sorting domain-containing protein [Ignavibacteria bacterium]|jgi:hypothetical protein